MLVYCWLSKFEVWLVIFINTNLFLILTHNRNSRFIIISYRRVFLEFSIWRYYWRNSSIKVFIFFLKLFRKCAFFRLSGLYNRHLLWLHIVLAGILKILLWLVINASIYRSRWKWIYWVLYWIFNSLYHWLLSINTLKKTSLLFWWTIDLWHPSIKWQSINIFQKRVFIYFF